MALIVHKYIITYYKRLQNFYCAKLMLMLNQSQQILNIRIYKCSQYKIIQRQYINIINIIFLCTYGYFKILKHISYPMAMLHKVFHYIVNFNNNHKYYFMNSFVNIITTFLCHNWVFIQYVHSRIPIMMVSKKSLNWSKISAILELQILFRTRTASLAV